jgi:hypothetical protein
MGLKYLQDTLAVLHPEPRETIRDRWAGWHQRIQCAPDWRALEGLVAELELAYNAGRLPWGEFEELIGLIIEVSRHIPEEDGAMGGGSMNFTGDSVI